MTNVRRLGQRTMMVCSSVRLLIPNFIAVVAIPLGAQVAAPTVVPRAVIPQPLVAEAMILSAPDGVSKYVFLPVTIAGRAGTLVLDTGAPIGLSLSGGVMTQLGIPLPRTNTLDSLIIGHSVERNVPVRVQGIEFDSQPGLPPVVGMMGNHMLARYDLLFDGPNRRVYLYAQPAASLGPPWLPTGIRPTDCVPIVHVGAPDDRYPGLSVQANGHAVMGVFDAGSNATYMNLAAAKVLGIRQSNPHVHRVPPDSSISFPGVGLQKEWVVTTGLVLRVGGEIMPDGPIDIFPTVNEINRNRNEPELDIGTDLLHDRRLFISYSSGRICLAPPSSPSPTQIDRSNRSTTGSAP